MNRFLPFIASILLLTALCSGQNFGGISESFALQLDFPSDQVIENLEVDMYIVYGSDLDLFERLVFDSLTSDALSVKSQARFSEGNETVVKDIKINKKLLSENETSLERLKEGAALIVLVGGRTHNSITGKVYDSGYMVNESTKFMGQLIVGRVDLDNDSKAVVLYHKIAGEGVRLEREAVKYSPLREVMPEEYVPVAATGIGLILMHLFAISKTIAEFLALDIGRKKKTFGHVGPKIMGVRVREAAAILGAASVLGFAVTWTFAGPSSGFLSLLFMNSWICLFAALSHELSHRLVGRLFGIKIEYRFWYMGSFITIVTAFLGNSFGIQGFLMEKIEGDISKWKYAATKLAAPLISTTITVIFAVLYLNNPGVVFQMVYTTASIWAMAEIMPVKGLDGYDIRRWNRLLWFLFFMTISIIFFTVNFIQ
jgi:hypothetical protein